MLPCPRGRSACSPACRPRRVVWMSHGDQVQCCQRRLHCPGRDRHLPGRRRPASALGRSTACSSTPRSATRRTAAESCATSSRGLRLPRAVEDVGSFIDQTVAEMRERVGQKRVICGLSGGVDSSVTAALLLKAVGPQVACIFVDNGLLRQGEAEAVRRTFPRSFPGRPARRRCRRALPESAGRRHRSAGEAARSSATCSSTSSRTKPGASRTPSSWPRARSIPT